MCRVMRGTEHIGRVANCAKGAQYDDIIFASFVRGCDAVGGHLIKRD